jgi:hypothetical protein
MNAQSTTPARFEPLAQAWLRFCQRPEFTIAWHTLLSHFRSGWLWGEVLLVLAVYAVFFDYPGTTGDIVYLSGFAGRVLIGLAVLSTAIMVHRAFLAKAYLPLARLSSRGMYVRGVFVAAAFLRLPLYLELLALYFLQHHSLVANWPTALLTGSIGLLANCTVVVAVALVLSPPIATRIELIVFLFWLCLALTSYTVEGPLGVILAPLRWPLLPLIACYIFGQTGVIDGWGVVALAVMVGYVVGLLRLSEALLARRDLLLQ